MLEISKLARSSSGQRMTSKVTMGRQCSISAVALLSTSSSMPSTSIFRNSIDGRRSRALSTIRQAPRLRSDRNSSHRRGDEFHPNYRPRARYVMDHHSSQRQLVLVRRSRRGHCPRCFALAARVLWDRLEGHHVTRLTHRPGKGDGLCPDVRSNVDYVVARTKEQLQGREVRALVSTKPPELAGDEVFFEAATRPNVVSTTVVRGPVTGSSLRARTPVAGRPRDKASWEPRSVSSRTPMETGHGENAGEACRLHWSPR